MFICVCEVHLFCKKLQDFQVSLLHIQLFQVLHLWAPSIRLPNTTIIFHRSQGLAWGFQPTHLQEVQEFEVDDLPPREEALDPWIPDSESNGGRYRKNWPPQRVEIYGELGDISSILTLIHSKVGYIYIYLLKSFAFTQIHDMFFAHILLVWWISRRRKSKISPQKNGGSVFTWTTGVSFHPTWGVLKSRCSLSFYENFWILGIPLTRPDLEFKMRKECTLHSDQQILMPCCDCPENSTRLKNIWMYWFWKFKDELYSYTYTYITYVNSK